MPLSRGFFPGVFTMGNVVCGFFALLSILEGNVIAACWLILLAGVLDVLDGKVARLSGSNSQFGVELDSLADFLSFGVVPGIIVYSLTLPTVGKLSWIVPVIFIMAAAYRLARYNLMADSEEKKDFLGLPVPGAALGLVSFTIFSYQLWEQVVHLELFIGMTLVLSFLMVSQVEYESLPDRYQSTEDRIRLALMVIAVPLLLFRPRLVLFPLVALYILAGIIRELLRLLTAGVGRVQQRYAERKANGREPHD